MNINKYLILVSTGIGLIVTAIFLSSCGTGSSPANNSTNPSIEAASYAVGPDNELYISKDQLNWDQVPTTGLSDNQVESNNIISQIKCDDDMCAAASDNGVLLSYNLVNWAPIESSESMEINSITVNESIDGSSTEIMGVGNQGLIEDVIVNNFNPSNVQVNQIQAPTNSNLNEIIDMPVAQNNESATNNIAFTGFFDKAKKLIFGDKGTVLNVSTNNVVTQANTTGLNQSDLEQGVCRDLHFFWPSRSEYDPSICLGITNNGDLGISLDGGNNWKMDSSKHQYPITALAAGQYKGGYGYILLGGIDSVIEKGGYDFTNKKFVWSPKTKPTPNSNITKIIIDQREDNILAYRTNVGKVNDALFSTWSNGGEDWSVKALNKVNPNRPKPKSVKYDSMASYSDLSVINDETFMTVGMLYNALNGTNNEHKISNIFTNLLDSLLTSLVFS